MIAACWHLCALAAVAAPASSIQSNERPGQVVVSVDGKPLATYVYAGDKEISRPYFAHVHAPGGIQVTRHHPPVPGKDAPDHPAFHPGIWLAFGDLDHQDDWRLKARVRHDRFVERPKVEGNQVSFVVQNSYCRENDAESVVCQEICRHTLSVEAAGYLLVYDSVFQSPDHSFAFGDQEEMGLGVRVATPIAVKSGGRMVDAKGRVNQQQIWGKSSAWCDYGGLIDGRRVGVMLVPDAANFRPARFHARDYGFIAANPFGQKVFGEPDESRVVVRPKEAFRLRFAVLTYSRPADSELDPQAAYEAVVRKLSELPRPQP